MCVCRASDADELENNGAAVLVSEFAPDFDIDALFAHERQSVLSQLPVRLCCV
jgi:hypothetical protein